MTDSTFAVVEEPDPRSERYRLYRLEWDRRGKELDPNLAPVHLDCELSCRCDLHCGATDENPKGFCNIWVFEKLL